MRKVVCLFACAASLVAAKYFDVNPCANLPSSECWQSEFRVGGNQLPASWRVMTVGSSVSKVGFGTAGPLTLTDSGKPAPGTPCGFDFSGIEIAFTETSDMIRNMQNQGTNYEIHVQFYVNDTTGTGGSVGIMYDWESDKRHKHVILSENPRCRNVIGYFDDSVTPTQLVDNPLPTVYGWEVNTLYEVRIVRAYSGGARDTTIEIRRWKDGSMQTLRPQRSAKETTLLSGAIGVFCSDLESCVFTRAYVHRSDRADQLQGALDCYGCNPGDGNVISIGTPTWCRCCGEGNTGCGPFSRDTCERESSFCTSTCVASKYCNQAYMDAHPTQPPSIKPPPTAFPTFPPVHPPTPEPPTQRPTSMPTARPSVTPTFPTPRPPSPPTVAYEFEEKCNAKNTGQCLASSKCVLVDEVCHDYRWGQTVPPTPAPTFEFEAKCNAKTDVQCAASSKCVMGADDVCHDYRWVGASKMPTAAPPTMAPPTMAPPTPAPSSELQYEAKCAAKTRSKCLRSSKCMWVDEATNTGCHDAQWTATPAAPVLLYEERCQPKTLEQCQWSSKCKIVNDACHDMNY